MRTAHLILLAALAAAASPGSALGDAPAPASEFVPPKLARTVDALAPPSLAERRQVEVTLTIDVDAAGKVIGVAVAQPAPGADGPAYDAAAMAAARQFVFAPGTSDGKPVPARVTFRTRFVDRVVRAPASPAEGGVPLDGAVLSRGDRVPLPGVDVLLDDGALSALTDDKGRFSFPAVAPGAHDVHLRGSIAGETDLKLSLAAGKKTSVTWYVTRKERYTSVVRGQRVVQETVEQTLTAEEVKHIPGTQGDTVKAVQNLPGMARPPFNGGLLVVWGSAPQDTRTYVDGVYIPTLFHFSGLRSTVNSEIVQSLTFMPGGYGVDYGRGLGGVVDIETREPRTDGVHGFAQIDVIDVSAMAEGPITKDLSFVAGARVSWLNLSLPLFMTSDVQASPQYWDYQAKLHWRASPRDDVDLLVFGSDDTLHLLLKDPNPALDQQFDTHMFYHRGLVKWTHRFDGGATFTLTPSVGYDMPYNVGFGYGNLPFSVINDQIEYNLRAVAHVPLGDSARLDAGLDYEGTRYSLDATQNLNGGLREGDSGGFGGLGGPDTTQAVATDHMRLFTNHVAPYAALVLSAFERRLTVTGQLRLEMMTFDGYPGQPNHFTSESVLFEPRLAVRYQVVPRFAIRAAAGAYHQAPDSQDLSVIFGNSSLKPMFGIHYVVGFETQITPTLHVEAQGFYKDIRNLVMRGDSLDSPQLVNDGIGRIYGGEVLIRQELWKNFFGWVSYTISRSERKDHPDSDWRLFEYDQTHILTLVASYKLPRGFQVGLRYRYATGNPYTPVGRAYYDVNSDQYLPIFGATYSGRLPAFNQLDLRVDKEFVFNRWKFIVYLDVENVSDAQSAEAAAWNYDFTRTTYVTGLPFLPVLGIRGEF